MKIGDRVLSKKTGEYGIITDIKNKNESLNIIVFFDNGELKACLYRELFKIK